MRRTIYLGVFILLSTIAGLLYYSDTRQSTALVATRDLSLGTRIQDGDIAVRRINPASVPTGVLKASDQAIGQIVSSPILEGQFLDARQVAPSRNASLLGSGLDVPAARGLEALIAELAAEGRGIVIATHDLVQARRWDEVLCLNTRQIAFGPPDQVLDREVLEKTYAGAIIEIPGSNHLGILPAHHH